MEKMEKAKIINLRTGQSLVCQFNPEELTLTKQINWNHSPVSGDNVGQVEYGSGQPETFNLKLIFDTTATGLDVRLEYALLLEMAKPGSLIPGLKIKEPAQCRFLWGAITSFTAVITSISQNFIMFLSNGTPVRANLDVAFQEVKDEAQQAQEQPTNPTTRSEPRKTRRVQQGDRLDLIAFEEYGDAGQWLALAEANELDNPLALAPGQILKIPILA